MGMVVAFRVLRVIDDLLLNGSLVTVGLQVPKRTRDGSRAYRGSN